MKGFINIIKPQNMSSAAVVSIVKKKFNLPCGHMGTLDPMATGVLPIGIAKTSRLFQYLLDKDKTYVAKFVFGFSTDTLDVTGKILEQNGKVPTIEQIKQVLPQFIGEIEQVPPNYSAKCINGKRGYQLARQGIEFEIPPKKVTIQNIKLINQISNKEFLFEIKCKGGTYIRSLARDIGLSCGCLATMSALDRTTCGIFNYQNGTTIEQLKNSDNVERFLIAPERSLNFEEICLSNQQAQRILDGIFGKTKFKDGLYKVFNEQDFWGVGQVEDGVLKIISYVR